MASVSSAKSELTLNPGYHLVTYELTENIKMGKQLNGKDRKKGQGFIHVPKKLVRDLTLSKENIDVYSFNVKFDKSRLDATFISIACLVVPYFIIKSICNHYLPVIPTWGIITLTCFSYAPLCIAFHAVRIALLPIGLLGHALYDIYKGKGVKKTLKSHAWAWVKQTGISLMSIPTSLYYALKFNMCHLVTIVSPRDGMRLAGQAEWEWNRKVPVNRGFSLLSFFGSIERQAQVEGGSFKNLQPTTWFLLRCFQPIATVHYIVDKRDPSKPITRWESRSLGGSLKGQVKSIKDDAISYIPDIIRITCMANA